MILTPHQCRAARALLEMSQAALADAAGIGLSTVRDLETERRLVADESCRKMRAALEKAGVIFLDENGEGPGARLKKRRR